MSHIKLQEELPGIIGLMAFRPETEKPLNDLAEVLLRGNSTLTRGEREIIASYVSYKNDCHFCHTTHGAVAAHHLGGDLKIIDDIKIGLVNTNISPKLRTLLNIAAKVQKGGKYVTDGDVADARKEGATDLEIHDTVLIAAAFCMFNRYVDGLATWAPQENEAYGDVGKRLANEGYVGSIAVPA